MARYTPPGLQAVATDGGRVIPVVDVYSPHKESLLLTSRTREDSPALSAGRCKVVDGDIETDETAEIQGTGRLRILVDDDTPGDVVPLTPTAPLSPVFGALVQVSFMDAETRQETSYGLYEVTETDAAEDGDGVTLEVQLADLSRRVQRARAYRANIIDNRTEYETMLDNLIRPHLTWPGAQLLITPISHRTGLVVIQLQDDLLRLIRKLTNSIGMWTDWNANGIGDVSIDAVGALDDPPIFTFVDGGNARVITARRNLSDRKAYNGVIVKGESPGSDKPPVYAEAWDLDRNSPTYFDPKRPQASAYGPVPFFYTSQFITTRQQAQDAAIAMLKKVVGLTETVTFSCLPHVGIKPGDPVRLERPRLGISGTFMVERVAMPFTGSAGHMTVTCKERRLTNIGPAGPSLDEEPF